MASGKERGKTQKSDTEQVIKKILDRLVESMHDYNEVYDLITTQRDLKKLDYANLLEKLDSSIETADLIIKIVEKRKIEIRHFTQLVHHIKFSAKALYPVVEGLERKATQTGKYSWLTRRRDLRNHNDVRKRMQHYSTLFSSELESEPNYIEVMAYVISPISDEILVEQISVPESDYNEFGDGKGIVYVLRAYEDGEPKDMIVGKKLWESMKAVYGIVE